jgi:hypothetical protein
MKKKDIKNNELAGNLFDKALKWYTSGDSGKRAAALELFPESVLKSAIDDFKKRDREERRKARNKELQEVLAECKKLFPIGTPIVSDDGTDHCVNIIVEEPHIASVQYRFPSGKYDFDETDRKSVIAKTVRLEYYGNDVIEGGWGRSYVGLEKCLINMKSDTEYAYPTKEHIIDLDKFHQEKTKERNDEIADLKKKIEEHQSEIEKLTKNLNELLAYDPYELTPEKIQEIVKQYKY